MIFLSPSFAAASAAYSVVDFPEPVGPVTNTMPFASAVHACIIARWSASNPSFSSPSSLRSLGSRRMTIDSPCTPGSADTRISISCPPTRVDIRPSCGSLRSAISIPEISFSRDATASNRSRGSCRRRCKTPSIRKRTAKILASGSR